MSRTRIWLSALFLALMATAGVATSPDGDCKPTPTPKAITPMELAARIDTFIEAELKARGVEPAPLASDAEFMRRIYLDLAGRIPTEAEARKFLADKAPDRLATLVETLLSSPLHVRHMSNTWQIVMTPPRTSAQATVQPGFRTWLEKQVTANAPYDKMVRDLLTAPMFNPIVMNPYGVFGTTGFNPGGFGGVGPGGFGPGGLN